MLIVPELESSEDGTMSFALVCISRKYFQGDLSLKLITSEKKLPCM